MLPHHVGFTDRPTDKTPLPVNYELKYDNLNISGRPQLFLGFRPDPARKLSANLYDIYHCCVYGEKILMMDRGTVRNM